MADFGSVTLEYNVGTDAAADWATGTALAFSGTAGDNELRWQSAVQNGAGTDISSVKWPGTLRPVLPAVVTTLWAFPDDDAGLQINYDGTIAQTMVLRLAFDDAGSVPAAMWLSAFASSDCPTPVPGRQEVDAPDGRNIINGSVDTGNTSYLKGAIFGSGYAVGGAQVTPATTGNAGSGLTIMSGAAGAVLPVEGQWSAWQSLQGWTQYLKAPAAPVDTTAFYWYVALALFVGPNLAPSYGTFAPLVLSYAYTPTT